MIQHVTVDHNTHDAVCEAARTAGMPYDQMLGWILSDWAQGYQRQRQVSAAIKADLKARYPDFVGVIPGGD